MHINRLKHTNTGKEYIDLINKDLESHNSKIKKYIELDLITDLPMPPKNNDKIVLQELDYLYNLNKNANEDEILFAQNLHDFRNIYKLFSRMLNKLRNINLTQQQIENICSPYDGVINFIKLKIARPRPYHLAKALNKNLNLVVDKRYTTGSYPSGHACEAYILAHHFGNLDAINRDIYLGAAYKIAKSRLIANVHFPSDIIGGFRLAKQLIKNNI